MVHGDASAPPAQGDVPRAGEDAWRTSSASALGQALSLLPAVPATGEPVRCGCARTLQLLDALSRWDGGPERGELGFALNYLSSGTWGELGDFSSPRPLWLELSCRRNRGWAWGWRTGAPWYRLGDPPGSDPLPSVITTGVVWVIKN